MTELGAGAASHNACVRAVATCVVGTSPTVSSWIASQLASWIVGQVLDSASARARALLGDTPARRAVYIAYEAAIAAFLTSLPVPMRDYADALEAFFRDDEVVVELAFMIEPGSLAVPDAARLRSALDRQGLDFSTLPGFQFDVALQSFVDGFVAAASRNGALRPVIHMRLSAEMFAVASATLQAVRRIQSRIEAYSIEEKTALFEWAGYTLHALTVRQTGGMVADFRCPGRRPVTIVGEARFSARGVEAALRSVVERS